MAPILRAFGGYLFLVFVVRLSGRRPGRQITPFEFVIIFFIGGLALTAIVGDDGSWTSAIAQIITISVTHYLVTFAKSRSPYVARLFDGTALTLLTERQWHAQTMHKTRMQDTDVESAARAQGLHGIDDVATAILERNGEISIEAR